MRSNWVYVVDDDPAVRGSLGSLLRIEGYSVRTFPSGEKLLAVLEELDPGCVVMDVRMPGMDGPEVQGSLAQTRPDLTVILITGDGDIPLAVRALKAGAADFLEKPFEPDALLESIRIALSGTGAAPEMDEAAARLGLLTTREQEVLGQLIAGDTSKEIARTLGGSPRTIEIHRSRVLDKLRARNVAEAVRIALSGGWR